MRNLISDSVFHAGHSGQCFARFSGSSVSQRLSRWDGVVQYPLQPQSSGPTDFSCTSVLLFPRLVCRSTFCRSGSQVISADLFARLQLYIMSLPASVCLLLCCQESTTVYHQQRDTISKISHEAKPPLNCMFSYQFR